jgi:hypothetical protein
MQVTEHRKFMLSKLIQFYQSENASLYLTLNIMRSEIFDLLVEHGDTDMVSFYIDEMTTLYFRRNLTSVIQYCMKYSKKHMLDHFIHKYYSDVDNSIQSGIENCMCRYAYQYNNIDYLGMFKTKPMSALYGACLGNNVLLVKNLLNNYNEDIFSSDSPLAHCASMTTSLEIIQLIYSDGYINDCILAHLLRKKMYDVVDWIVDNNLELRSDYGASPSRDYLFNSLLLEINCILYLIRNKKLKVLSHHINFCPSNVTLLLLIHFNDYECPFDRIVFEDKFEQFLSMYPNCDKTKFKSIRCNDINGDKYIEQYLDKRDMLHNEMRLLYDLPDDLCKQII